MSERMLDRIQESAWGKVHADYCWNVIEWQGNYLCWKVRRRHYKPDNIKKRGNVKGFSRSSRLRLMKSFARIDIGENMPYLFMTLTYPDTVLLRDRWIEKSKLELMTRENYLALDYLHITQHRWVFWRYLEKHLGKQIPGIWRIEYKPRLSGVHKDFPMPHLHILIAQHGYVRWQEVRWFWQSTIGERFVNVDVRGVYNPEVTLHYLSKYIGKEETDTLEHDAYLDSLPFGRQWGYMRKPLIKQEDKWTGRYFETDQLASLRQYASPESFEVQETGMCSFTLIGPRAKEIGNLLLASDLDGHIHLE